MQPTSKWILYVEKRQYIVTGAEVQAILNAGQARFVKLRKLVVNPAFISEIVEVEDGKKKPLELSEPPMSEAKKARIEERMNKIRQKFNFKKHNIDGGKKYAVSAL